METPHDFVQTVRIMFEAFSQRDAVRFVEYLDPNIEWTSAENFIYAEARPRVGIQAVVQHLFGRVLVDWDNFKMVPVEILGSGDVVIASGRFRGAFKANGAPIDAQFVQVFQFKGGKVTKIQMYTDTAQFRDTVTAIRSTRA
jgi:ketosteroid isomerase-like protein